MDALPDHTIIRNSMVTPDGTEIVSLSRHDCVTHLDENGETYMVDGGRSYLRRSVNVEEGEDTTITLLDGHEVVREVFTWGSKGERIKLCDMESDHIEAILKDGYNVWPLMKAELMWRAGAASRKEVRLQDIERIQRHIEKRPEVLGPKLEQIIERFNENEYN